MSKVDGESHYTRKTLCGTWVFIHFSVVNTLSGTRYDKLNTTFSIITNFE